jgi:hypothetical protein
MATLHVEPLTDDARRFSPEALEAAARYLTKYVSKDLGTMDGRPRVWSATRNWGMTMREARAARVAYASARSGTPDSSEGCAHIWAQAEVEGDLAVVERLVNRGICLGF